MRDGFYTSIFIIHLFINFFSHLTKFQQLVIVPALKLLSSCACCGRELTQIIQAVIKGVIVAEKLWTIFSREVTGNRFLFFPPIAKFVADPFPGTCTFLREDRSERELGNKLQNVVATGTPQQRASQSHFETAACS